MLLVYSTLFFVLGASEVYDVSEYDYVSAFTCKDTEDLLEGAILRH
jgi:hypothetical protein